MILQDLLEPGESISSDQYIAMLTKLKAQTSRVMAEKTAFLLQHKNTRPHNSLMAMEHVGNPGCTVLPHYDYVKNRVL